MKKAIVGGLIVTETGVLKNYVLLYGETIDAKVVDKPEPESVELVELMLEVAQKYDLDSKEAYEQIVADLKAQEEGNNSYKDFFNSECARPIDLDSLGGEVERGDISLEKYQRKQIPDDVKSITVGVDVG